MYFKLRMLAHVHFPPHEPYIVTTFTHSINLFCEDNGEGILWRAKNIAL